MGITTGERRDKILPALTGLILLMSPALWAFGVTPTRVELSLSPGDTYEGHYEISNKGGQNPVRVSIEIKDWDMDSQSSVIMRDEPVVRDFSAMALDFSPRELTIPPDSSVKVGYKVSLPKECAGEFKKYLIFKCSAEKKDKGGLSMATQMSFPFYVVVKGTEVFKYEISDINIKSAVPVEIEISLCNTGNVHVRPTGEITITRVKTKKPLLKMPVNTPRPGWPVLPGQEFRFLLRDQMRLEPGDYVLSADFDEQGIKASREARFKIDSDGNVR